jgi:hypothetical protein
MSLHSANCGNKQHGAGWTGYMDADVRYDSRLSSTAKVLMVEISALTNKEGYAWATNQYFTETFGISKSQVTRIIRQLAECGYINVYLNPGGDRYITITRSDRPVPSGFKKDYTKKEEPKPVKDEMPNEVTSAGELISDTDTKVDTSGITMRKLTNAEYSEWMSRNDKVGNTDRRGNVIDQEVSDKIALEIIAKSNANCIDTAEEQKPVRQIEAKTQENDTQVVKTKDSPYGSLATSMTSTRKNYNPAEKAFYDAAKALGVSIANHNQARSWVKEVVRTRGIKSTVNYFDFMRLIFPKWEYEYKPNIDSAHDLAMKAAKIEQLIQRQQRENARKINYDNIDFYG